jgi:hypothetical protein
MPQIFHRSMNPFGKLLVLGLPLIFGTTGLSLAIFYRSSYATGRDEIVEQPVPFSHAHHVGQLGIDCRYCHTSVETSGFAGFPPTKTCMNCHQQMWVGAELLNPVRESYKTDKAIPWNKVHDLPQYAYFNHSIHIAQGVGCVSCHGRIDEMPLIFQSNTLLMEWCLNCHREPEKYLRPKSEVFSMTWKPSDVTNPDTGVPYTQAELGAKLKEAHQVRDASYLTSCSMCHR